MHRIMLHGFMNTGFKETKKRRVNTNHLSGGGLEYLVKVKRKIFVFINLKKKC